MCIFQCLMRVCGNRLRPHWCKVKCVQPLVEREFSVGLFQIYHVLWAEALPALLFWRVLPRMFVWWPAKKDTVSVSLWSQGQICLRSAQQGKSLSLGQRADLREAHYKNSGFPKFSVPQLSQSPLHVLFSPGHSRARATDANTKPVRFLCCA